MRIKNENTQKLDLIRKILPFSLWNFSGFNDWLRCAELAEFLLERPYSQTKSINDRSQFRSTSHVDLPDPTHLYIQYLPRDLLLQFCLLCCTESARNQTAMFCRPNEKYSIHVYWVSRLKRWSERHSRWAETTNGSIPLKLWMTNSFTGRKRLPKAETVTVIAAYINIWHIKARETASQNTFVT